MAVRESGPARFPALGDAFPTDSTSLLVSSATKLFSVVFSAVRQNSGLTCKNTLCPRLSGAFFLRDGLSQSVPGNRLVLAICGMWTMSEATLLCFPLHHHLLWGKLKDCNGIMPKITLRIREAGKLAV